jgi:hypothetical protein
LLPAEALPISTLKPPLLVSLPLPLPLLLLLLLLLPQLLKPHPLP